MLGRPVALVLVEAVARVTPVVRHHHPVPGDFGNDGCCSDTHYLGITADNAADGNGPERKIKRIHQDEVWSDRQLLDTPPEGAAVGLAEAVAINFLLLNCCRAPSDRSVNDLLIQFFSLLGRQLFGIIQANELKLFW